MAVKKKKAKASAPAKKTTAQKVTAKKVANKKAVKAASKSAKPKVPAKKAAPVKTRSKAPMQSKAPAAPLDADHWDQLISPLDDRLLIAPQPKATMTAGGLHIPDSVTNRPVRGHVLAKGPGRRNKKGQLRPLDVAVGDEVLYAEWSGSKIEVGGQEILILREEEVLGIVTV